MTNANKETDIQPGRIYLVVGAPINPRLWNLGRFVSPVKFLEDDKWLVGPVDERRPLRGANDRGVVPMKSRWLVEVGGPEGLGVLNPIRPLVPCTET